MSITSLRVTPPPHLHSGNQVRRAMFDVLIALLPITAVSIYVYRAAAVTVLLTSIISCLVFQWIVTRMSGKPLALTDGSAVVTGVLLALCFQAYTHWVTVVVGAFLAIVVAKELMGGIGWNRFNPALFGRVGVIILAPLTTALSSVLPRIGPSVPDTITGATPMALLSQGMAMPSKLSMLIAYPGGGLGEVSAIALIVGAAYLLYRGHLKWRISLTMIAAVGLSVLVFGRDPVYHILGGGLLLGALFMASDWTTSPVTVRGQVVFGIAAGLITALIRVGMPPAEGVAVSILIANAFAPVLDRALRPLRFGELAGRARA